MMQTRAQELAALQAQNPPPINNPDIQATPAIPDNDDEDDNTPAAAEGLSGRHLDEATWRIKQS